MWRWSSLHAALIAAFAVLVWASAAVGAIDPQRARQAEMEMLALIAAVRTGEAPRISDPSVALAFSRAFDGELIVDHPPSTEDLAVLSSLQQRAGELARAYISIGVRADHDRQGAMEQAAGNFLEFLPELGVIYDYRLAAGARICAITAELAQRIGAFGDEEPDLEASVAMIETIQYQVLELVLGFASDQHIEREWRFERLVLLNGFTEQYAQLLTATTARSLADLALAAAISEADPRISNALQQFAFAILRR